MNKRRYLILITILVLISQQEANADNSKTQAIQLNSYLPLILSSLSFVVSLIITWINVLRPAKIGLYQPPRISFATDAFDFAENSFTITFTHNFYNKGAITGAVDNLVLIVHNLTNNQKLAYRPYVELLDKALSFGEEAYPIPKYSPFNSIIIRGKEIVVKSLMYRKVDLNKIMTLTPGLYDIRIFIKKSTDKHFKEATNAKINLTGEEVEKISKVKRTLQDDGRYYVQMQEMIVPISDAEDLLKSFSNNIISN